jgi:hypothetical protein
MAQTVIGILENPNDTQKVVDELLKSGFERRDIGVISTDIMREAATAAAGAGKGMAFGALAGMLISAVTMMIPGLGPILVAGPGLTLLGGTTLGALAGGIVGALKERGVPEEQANFYAEGVRRGGTLITVHAKTDDLAQRAVEVLKRSGAVDIDQRVADWKRFGWSGGLGRLTPGAKKTAAAKPAQAQTTEAVPVVPLAAVEVYSMVIEMPDEETGEAAQTGAAAERRTAPPRDRRVSGTAYAGQERRQAARA